MVTVRAVAVAAGTALLVAAALPGFLRLLAEGGLARRNYRERLVPVSAGFLPAFAAGFASIAHAAAENPLGFATAALTFGALGIGLLDDVAGTRHETGLKGHFAALLRGKLTTGALKAILLPALALGVASSLKRPAPWVIVDAALMSLSANAVNLLDVRPGRGIKGALLLLTAAALGSLSRPAADLWLAFAVSVAAYAPWDLRSRAMLGDSGANAFGLVAGWFCVLALSPVARLVLLTLLSRVQVRAERDSLSRWIESSRLLSALDRWGRR